MGSTFKILNTAMALDSGKFTATDMIDVVSPLRVGRFPIRDFKKEKKPLNVAEVMVVSSNKGSARIADELGAEVQKQYLKELGLLNRLDLEIPETAAPLAPANMAPVFCDDCFLRAWHFSIPCTFGSGYCHFTR